MLAWVARRKYLAGLRDLEGGKVEQLLRQFDESCTLTFLGDTPLGAQLTGRDALRRWFDRFRLLLPDATFTVRRCLVTGPPWRQQLAAHVVIRSTVVGEPYENQFAHLLTLRWGRVIDDLVIEDTQRWANACQRLVAAGAMPAFPAF